MVFAQHERQIFDDRILSPYAVDETLLAPLWNAALHLDTPVTTQVWATCSTKTRHLILPGFDEIAIYRYELVCRYMYM